MVDLDLSPVENRDGLWYKREDLFIDPIWGVNGSKYRTWSTIIKNLPEKYGHVVVAGSVHAPTVPIVAVSALEAGLGCTVIVGGTTPIKAQRHPYIKIAVEAGASIRAIKVGYNPALQKASKEFEANHENVWRVAAPDPETATERYVLDFLMAGSNQLTNLPDEIETLVIPFGSGITASGILYGLHDERPANLRKIVLVGIGPDKLPWVTQLLERAGRSLSPDGVDLFPVSLYPNFAKYSDRMKETQDGIVFHPTYEGKVVRYLNEAGPEWWDRRDGTTCMWVVGGPF